MSTKRKHRVVVGSLRATIFAWVHPRSRVKGWRFGWRDGERWRWKTCGTLDGAKIEAERILGEQLAGGMVWSGLSPERQRWLAEVERLTVKSDEAVVLDFLRNRGKSTEVVAAVARFATWKEVEAGEETPHLRTVRLALEGMAARFAGRAVAEISTAELAEWLEERAGSVGPKRRKDLRAALCSFWKWAKREGMAGNDPVTAPERLPTPKVGAGERRVLTPAELLRVAAEVRSEWRAWVVLGAFAGLRPEEIAPGPNKRSEKRGLRCEEIDWDFGVVRVPAVVSKVGRPRIVPMSDALRVWLRWAGIEPGMQGPVVLRNPSHHQELARLGGLIWQGEGWPQDALRHSYGSYRNAVVRNLGQVAEEMGTSEAMLHRHYHNPKAEEEGAEWFRQVPIKSGLEGDGFAISEVATA